MKTIILTNGNVTEEYEVTEADFATTMNLARLTAEARGEGWEAKEPTPPEPEPIDEPTAEPIIEDTTPPNDETPVE